MVETNTEVKVEEEFPEEIKLGIEVIGDSNDMSKEERSSARGKNRYVYEEGTEKVTGNKEIEQGNKEIAVCENIAFWP